MQKEKAKLAALLDVGNADGYEAKKEALKERIDTGDLNSSVEAEHELKKRLATAVAEDSRVERSMELMLIWTTKTMMGTTGSKPHCG